MPNLFVWRASLFATLGVILVGYSDGTMNGILEMQGFKSTFKELVAFDNFSNETSQNVTCSSETDASTTILIGLVVAISNLGSAGGSLLAGWLSDHFSRKYGILVGGLVMAVGSAILASSFHIWLFAIGRGISGIGVGILYMVVPIYISETSPKEWRGALTSLIGVGYAGGLLLALSTNVAFSLFVLGWRVALAVHCAACLPFVVGMRWMTHTPRWLVMRKRKMESLLVLNKISGGRFVDSYLELEELEETMSKHFSIFDTIKEMMRWKYCSRLLVVVALFFVLASTGNFLYFYTTTLFCGVSVPSQYAAISVGIIGVAAAIVLLFIIDKVGRRASLLCGAIVNTVLALSAASLIFVYGSESVLVSGFVLAIVCIYAFSTDSTWLTIPFVVNSEIFPMRLRGLAVGLATASYWTFTFLINEITPYILGSTARFFYIIAGISFLAIFLVLFALPETKGVSLENMDEIFSQGCLRPLFSSCLRSSSRQETSEEISNDSDDEKAIGKSLDEKAMGTSEKSEQ